LYSGDAQYMQWRLLSLDRNSE